MKKKFPPPKKLMHWLQKFAKHWFRLNLEWSFQNTHTKKTSTPAPKPHALAAKIRKTHLTSVLPEYSGENQCAKRDFARLQENLNVLIPLNVSWLVKATDQFASCDGGAPPDDRHEKANCLSSVKRMSHLQRTRGQGPQVENFCGNTNTETRKAETLPSWKTLFIAMGPQVHHARTFLFDQGCWHPLLRLNIQQFMLTEQMDF